MSECWCLGQRWREDKNESVGVGNVFKAVRFTVKCSGYNALNITLWVCYNNIFYSWFVFSNF